MSGQAQSNPIIIDRNVRMMIHILSKLCNSVEKTNAVHEIIEDEGARYSPAAPIPMSQCDELNFYLTLGQPHRSSTNLLMTDLSDFPQLDMAEKITVSPENLFNGMG